MIPAALLPPVQAPPHDPRAISLSPDNGWGQASLNDLHIDTGNGELVLNASAGEQRVLTEISGTFGGLVLPTNVAWSPSGDVFALAQRRERLLRFDPCECRFDVVPCFPEKKEQDALRHRLAGIGFCD